MSEKYVEMTGSIVNSLGNGFFEVKVDSSVDTKIVCNLSGKIRQNKIRILPGDAVKIQLSPYDLSHGRIVVRL